METRPFQKDNCVISEFKIHLLSHSNMPRSLSLTLTKAGVEEVISEINITLQAPKASLFMVELIFYILKSCSSYSHRTVGVF